MVLTLLPVVGTSPSEETLTKITRPDFPSAILNVFFRAMSQGYAAVPQKGTLDEIPGSKTIRFMSGPWTVLDAYVVTPAGDWSGGTTHIMYDGVTVWMMQYMGWYRKEAIPCLKAALRYAYERNFFFGGRGLGEYTLASPDPKERMRYFNEVDPPGMLRRIPQFFSGREHIVSPDGEPMGFHRYQGQLMVAGSNREEAAPWDPGDPFDVVY